MESGFLTFILVSTFEVYSSQSGITDWEDVMVAREGMRTTLVCTDSTVRGAIAINWMVKSLDEWKLVLSASGSNQFSGGASKASTRLIDVNFKETGVFSLSLVPTLKDSGLYSCLIKQQERKLKEKIILLAVLTVTVLPAAPIPQLSTVRLAARVNPGYAVAKITWAAPGGINMKSKKTNTDTVAKLPEVQYRDGGAYVCMVHPWGNSSNTLFPFNVNVTVDADNVASFNNITYEKEISTATQAQTPFPLTCPGEHGDYVRLHWLPPDSRRHSDMKLVYQNDSWGGSTFFTNHSKRLQLAGPPYNAEAGSFSFLLTPELKDGGLYTCEVFLDGVAFSQRTILSVLTATVKTRHASAKLELGCMYSERSQVQSVDLKYQNESRRLHLSSNSPGRITTILPLPITSDSAGNYTCTLQLNNGQTVWATQAVTLPRERGRDVEGVSVTTPSLLPSLSALLLLVPLVAAAVCVLLWRRKHTSDRGVEQSVHSGEAENVYENIEDIRQAPPQGSVYMDLKPRAEDDVYKELERY